MRYTNQVGEQVISRVFQRKLWTVAINARLYSSNQDLFRDKTQLSASLILFQLNQKSIEQHSEPFQLGLLLYLSI